MSTICITLRPEVRFISKSCNRPALTGNRFLATDAIRHFYLVTLHREARHVMAVDELGRIIDEVYQRVGK
jgi:hypothetical protein